MNIRHQPKITIRANIQGGYVVRHVDVNGHVQLRSFQTRAEAERWGFALEEASRQMGRCNRCGAVVFQDDYCKACIALVKFWINYEETARRIAKHISVKLNLHANCDQDVWHHLNSNGLFYQEVFAAAEELTCPSAD